MTDLTKPVSLNIPDEALELIIELDAVEAGIRLAIAAELDRLADEWGPKPLPANVTLIPGSALDLQRETNWTCAVRLRGRARELRGESS
jgi:hypothetical protein